MVRGAPERGRVERPGDRKRGVRPPAGSTRKVSMAKDIQVGDVVEVTILARRRDEEVTYTGEVTKVDSQTVEIGGRLTFKFRHRWTVIRAVRRGR